MTLTKAEQITLAGALTIQIASISRAMKAAKNPKFTSLYQDELAECEALLVKVKQEKTEK